MYTSIVVGTDGSTDRSQSGLPCSDVGRADRRSSPRRHGGAAHPGARGARHGASPRTSGARRANNPRASDSKRQRPLAAEAGAEVTTHALAGDPADALLSLCEAGRRRSARRRQPRHAGRPALPARQRLESMRPSRRVLRPHRADDLNRPRAPMTTPLPDATELAALIRSGAGVARSNWSTTPSSACNVSTRPSMRSSTNASRRRAPRRSGRSPTARSGVSRSWSRTSAARSPASRTRSATRRSRTPASGRPRTRISTSRSALRA